MARRLKTIAKDINETMSGYGYEASIVGGYSCTDVSKAGRLMVDYGNDRYGNKIVVKKDGKVVLSHDSTQTYRKNSEVEFWLEQEKKKLEN
jgi:hypothetical protein